MADYKIKILASVEQFLDQAEIGSRNLYRVKGLVKWIGKPMEFKGHDYRRFALTDTDDHEAPELICVFKDDATKKLNALEGNLGDLVTVQGFCKEKEGVKRLTSAKLIQDYDTAAPQATAQFEENAREDSIIRQAILKALGHLASTIDDVPPLLAFINEIVLPWAKGLKPKATDETNPFED